MYKDKKKNKNKKNNKNNKESNKKVAVSKSKQASTMSGESCKKSLQCRKRQQMGRWDMDEILAAGGSSFKINIFKRDFIFSSIVAVFCGLNMQLLLKN